MSALYVVFGFIAVCLFSTAGYRASNNARHRKEIDAITYHGRIHALYAVARRSAVLSVATIVRRAAIAKSVPAIKRQN